MKRSFTILSVFTFLLLITVGCTPDGSKSNTEESSETQKKTNDPADKESPAEAEKQKEANNKAENSAEDNAAEENTANNTGGDDSPLVGKEWKIEDINNQGVIDNSHATLAFSPDGNLGGSATCNQMIGSYTVDGDQLHIELKGLTKKMCAEALMNQEHTLTTLLPNVESFALSDTGALVLTTKDGKTITARR